MSDSLLRLVADSVPALVAYYDWTTLRCRFANRRYAEYNGWTPDTVLGRPLREIIGDEADDRIKLHVALVRQGQPVHYRREQTLPDGSRRMIEVHLTPHFADAGEQIGVFVLINDITEQWRSEQAMRDSELRLRRFAEATSEGIVFHRNGLVIDANVAMLRLAGYAREEVLGRHITEFVPESWRPMLIDYMRAEGAQPVEAELVCKDGQVVPVEFVGRTLPCAGELCRLVVVRDIRQHKQAQERIEFLALHDMLTQLPNRHYLNEYLPKMLALARRQHKAAGLLFVDLDNFKQINDSMGHDGGDAVLREVARRLLATVRDSDLVIRLGGDEFLVVLTGIEQPADVTRAAKDLLAALQQPVVVQGCAGSVFPSIGISLFPEHGETMDQLIRHADTAMYRAKNAGGNRYDLFAAPAAGAAE